VEKISANIEAKNYLIKEKTFRDILFIYVVIYICYGILPISTDNLAYIGINYNQIGLIISANFVVQIFSILFFGYYAESLSKRFGRKKVFFILNVITFTAYGLVSIVQNFYQFITLVIIAAISIGAFLPFGFSIISDLFPPDERGKRYGFMSFGVVLGAGGGILFGLLMDLFLPSEISWRFVYILASILGIWPTIAYGIKGIDPKHGESEPELEDYKDFIDYDFKITLRTLGSIFSKKTVFGILMIVLATTLTNSALGNWAITYWRDFKIGIGVSNPEFLAVLIYIIAGLGAIPGNLIGGRIGDRFYREGRIKGRIYISILGMITGLFCLIAFYLLPFPSETLTETIFSTLIFVCIGFMGYLLTGFPPANMYAMLSEVCIMEHRSSANSFYGLMMNIGATVGNPLFTFLLTNYDHQFAMMFMFLFWVIGLVFWILPYKYYPKEAKECRELIKERRDKIKNHIEI